MFRRIVTTLISFAALTLAAFADPWKVSTLHPLLTDLAKQVGGEHVEVIDLIGRNGDPHHFEPTADALRRGEGSRLYLAAGKGLESYLPQLRSIVGANVTILEVGKSLPSMEGSCDHPDHDHGDHDHHHATEDPHWWHSIDLFRRATTIVATAFAEQDPSHAADYQKNATAYRAKLDELEKWTKRELARIPRERRKLATAHSAFGYFCKDFGFTPIPVQGINRERVPTPQELAEIIAKLRNEKVFAIFPEKESNPKILTSLTRDTGIKLSETPLFADGSGTDSYDSMFRHNITTIVKALTPASNE